MAAANPHTIVVLETGTPVLTPWRGQVAGLLEAWYPGERAGPAIARVLFGDVDPSGRLPVDVSRPPPETSPPRATRRSTQAWPTTSLTRKACSSATGGTTRRNLTPAFPFGFGLSYTRFHLSGLRVLRAPRGLRAPGGAPAQLVVTATVKNSGAGGASPFPSCT